MKCNTRRCVTFISVTSYIIIRTCRQNCVVRNDVSFPKVAYLLPRYWTSWCWQDTIHLPTLYSTGVHSLCVVHQVTCAHTFVQRSERGYILQIQRQIPQYRTHSSTNKNAYTDGMYSNHTLYHFLRHCIALLDKLLMWHLTVLNSLLKFYIVDLTPVFYVHIDIFSL
jgi:hypothetical protein